MFLKNIYFMADGDAGGGGTATEAAPAEGSVSSEETATSTEPASSSPEGLLSDSRNKNNGSSVDPEAEVITAPTPAGEVAHRPLHIAEQFWDSEKGEVKTESLANSYNDLRKEFNKKSQEKGAPEKAEEYLADWKPAHRARAKGKEQEGEVLDRYGDLDPNDPVFEAMSKFAKNGNMSPGAFQDGMQDLMEELHPLLPQPFNAEKELALLGEGAEQMVRVNQTWIDSLEKNGTLNENQTNILLKFGSTAEGVQLVNSLRLNSGEKPIPRNLNGGVPTGRKTPEECQAMMDDPRYFASGTAADAYREEVSAEFAKTYGTAKA